MPHRFASTAASVLLVLGAASTARAYTLKHTRSGARVRWHAAEVPLEVAPVRGGSVSPGALERALRRGAAEWSAVPGAPRLRVRGGATAPDRWGYDGVNGVYVLERWPFPDRRLAVTVSTRVEATGELLDTDVLVNGEMAFDMLSEGHRPGDRFDLGLVITHELGHVLGLDESERPEATMWPDIRPGEMRRRELAADDVDGVMDLYEASASGPSGPGGGEAGAPTTTSWGCSAAPGAPAGPAPLFALLVAALARGARLTSPRRRRSGPSRRPAPGCRRPRP